MLIHKLERRIGAGRIDQLPKLWRSSGGDGDGHGIGGIGGHRGLVWEPVEDAEDYRAGTEVDEQDGQCSGDAVPVEVNRVRQPLMRLRIDSARVRADVA